MNHCFLWVRPTGSSYRSITKMILKWPFNVSGWRSLFLEIFETKLQPSSLFLFNRKWKNKFIKTQNLVLKLRLIALKSGFAKLTMLTSQNVILQWWDVLPIFIKEEFFKDTLDLTNYDLFYL